MDTPTSTGKRPREKDESRKGSTKKRRTGRVSFAFAREDSQVFKNICLFEQKDRSNRERLRRESFNIPAPTPAISSPPSNERNQQDVLENAESEKENVGTTSSNTSIAGTSIEENKPEETKIAKLPAFITAKAAAQKEVGDVEAEQHELTISPMSVDTYGVNNTGSPSSVSSLPKTTLFASDQGGLLHGSPNHSPMTPYVDTLQSLVPTPKSSNRSCDKNQAAGVMTSPALVATANAACQTEEWNKTAVATRKKQEITILYIALGALFVVPYYILIAAVIVLLIRAHFRV